MAYYSKPALIILSLALTTLTLISACTSGPPAPIPWFIEHIKVESVSLPEGVDIQVIQRTDYGNLNEFLVVSNTSPTPLYLTGTQSGVTTFEPFPIELPAGSGPVDKIVSGQAFSWRPFFDTPDSPARMGWGPEMSYDRPGTVWIYISANHLWSGDGLILDLEPRNQFDGHRPADVAIPEAQTVSLPLVYGAQVIHVPLTISYTLNPKYYEAIRIEPGLFCALSILGLLVMIWVGSSVYRRISRKWLR